MEQLQYGSQMLEFELSYADRKSLAIEVHPDLTLKVIAPRGASREAINARLLKRGRWIIRQQKYFEQFLPRVPAREYVGGESHFYLGKKYPLQIRMGKAKSVKLKNGQLQVVAPGVDSATIKKLLGSWYYDHAMVQFQEVFDESLHLFKRFKLEPPHWEIRRMKNRWGSCVLNSRMVYLNPELIKAPKRCIQYVVIHELCHLVERNHNNRFYQLLSELMPGWERWKMRLESS